MPRGLWQPRRPWPEGKPAGPAASRGGSSTSGRPSPPRSTERRTRLPGRWRSGARRPWPSSKIV
ncbi:MAG: hypothetical protein AMJ81_01480 [Phycisphaerae bacterium SM23_33]|nr:MAG: hypothetical protein AMJ81_01480 [Phycisphaerae bacterium SM23_33]